MIKYVSFSLIYLILISQIETYICYVVNKKRWRFLFIIITDFSAYCLLLWLVSAIGHTTTQSSPNTFSCDFA